ncbi:MAG: HAD family hydrolase [Thermoplasmata archaeon]|nr:HAD family hydrolase [Thermoplasmata archaeon]
MATPSVPPYSAVLIMLEDGLVPWQTLSHWQWAWRPRGPMLSERSARAAIKRSVLGWDRRRWLALTGGSALPDAQAYRGHLKETLAAIAGHPLPDAETEAVVGRFLKPTNEVEAFPDALPSLGALLTRGVKVGVVSSLPAEVVRWSMKRSTIPDSLFIEPAAGTAGFPDPVAFRAAVEKLGVPRKRTMFVGPLFWSDVRAAGRAGLNAELLDRHDWWARVEAPRWSSLRPLVDAPQAQGTATPPNSPEPSGAP